MNGIAWDRRPAFWIAYVILSALSLALAWKLFPQAMPIVNLDITMTRDAAIARAGSLATQYKLAPEDARHAVVFNQDGLTQSYVELEGGGKEAFAKLVAGRAYAPYWWEVRLFKPGVVEEALIRFKPDGTRYGFVRRVAETYVRDAKTKALDSAAALALARTRAAEDWSVDFSPYRLLDQSQQTQPSGRIDHQFVFEREEAIGEARVRLGLVVSGDELTTVYPFVHVPESFIRRFAEMRSTNNAIASFASITAGVLYGLIGCALGALWLLRRRYLVWKGPLAAGFVVSGLLAASMLANAQAAWFVYATAQDETTFWIKQAGMVMLTLVGGGLALGEAFMASEGLARRAFPNHPQLWRIWSREAGGTREIAGRTIGGYLFVPIELGLIAVFYFVTNRYLGWWQPSEQLTDPNILASAAPALMPIANSLQAGMLEECVFRAIPLSLGALLGAYYGRRGLGIAIALVLQAIVFGAAHANYPGFPSYSRLVELFVPALLWAGIFLRYGLLPTILLHALFDLVLFSIPLFLIDAPGADLWRGVVVAAALVPLAVVLVRRAQNGAWGTLPIGFLNGAWTAPAAPPPPVDHPISTGEIGSRALALQRLLPVLGVAGLAAYIAFTPLHTDVPPLAIDRAAATEAAAAALAERGVKLGPEWVRMAVPRSALEDSNQRLWHGFVWREAGETAYRALVGNALAPPLWDVRFARFDGDVAERAEEWRVTVIGDGRIRQVMHRLPEGRSGATLERDNAQSLAERALQTQFGSDANMLVLRGADQTQRPARRDWVFAYVDPRINVGKSGEARVQVALAGDEVVSAGRSLFVPEAWQRSESERDGRRELIRSVALGTIAAALIGALVFAVNAWGKGRVDRRALLLVSVLLFVVFIASSANNWPARAFALQTIEPVASQITRMVLALAAGGVLLALLGGLLAGVGIHYARLQVPVRLAGRLPSWACGAMAALATAGIAAALAALVPNSLPVWPDLKQANSASPLISAVLFGTAVIPAAALTLFLLAVFDRVTAGWRRRLAAVAFALIVISVAVAIVAGHESWQAVPHGAIEGAIAFAFAWMVLRYDLRAVPAFVATGLALEAFRSASLAATPAAWLSFGIAVAVAAVVAWAVTRYIERPYAAPQ